MKRRDYIIGVFLAFVLGMLVTYNSNPNPECWEQTIKDTTMWHRVSCPEGVK